MKNGDSKVTPKAASREIPGVSPEIETDAFQSFIADFYALMAGMQQLRSQLASIAGVPNSGFAALAAIDHLSNLGDVSVNDLARHLRIRGSSVTVEMGRLVELGLVEKYSDAKDKRRVLLRLTEKSRSLLAEMTPVWELLNRSLFKVLEPKDFDTFRQAIASILDQIDPAIAIAKIVSEQSKSGREGAKDAIEIAARHM